MTPTQKLFAVIGFSMLALVAAAVWWTLPRNMPVPGSGQQKPNPEVAEAEGRDCLDDGLRLMKFGEVEVGAEVLLHCRNAGTTGLNASQANNAATIEFNKILNSTPAVWPAADGTIQPIKSPEEAAGRIQQLEKFIDSHPGSYHASLAAFYKTLLLYRAGRYPECIAFAEASLNTSASPDYGIYIAALASRKTKDFKKLAELSNMLVVMHPDSSAAAKTILLEADVLAGFGQFKEAAAKAIKVLQGAFPAMDRGNAAIEAARYFLKAGDPTAASKALLVIGQKYPAIDTDEKFDDFFDILKGDYFSPADRISLAHYFIEKERGYPAVLVMSPVVSASPLNRLMTAEAYYVSGEYSNSEKQLGKLPTKETSELILGQACVLRGKIYMRRAKWDNALAQFTECISKYGGTGRDSLANMIRIYMIKEDFASRAAAAEKFYAVAPSDPDAPQYLLLAARQYLTTGDFIKAEALFNAMNTEYPVAYDTAEGAFWAAKILYGKGSYQSAAQLFTNLRDRFPYSYFYYRAGDYLSTMGYQVTPLKSLIPQYRTDAYLAPVDSYHLKNGNAFRHLGLDDLALSEFEQAAVQHPNESSIGVARILRNENRMPESVKVIENRVKVDPAFYRSVLASDTLTELLFPIMFMDHIRPQCAQYNLNPAWPISIIRQESRFKTDARSSSNAKGLMQIIPSTGKWIAKKIGHKGFGSDQLYKVDTNVKFGTWYFDYLLGLEHINGNSALALAGYNGGPGNVKKWVTAFGVKDIDLFIEQIPRDETRGYVKKVMLNYFTYSQLLDN